MSKWIPIAKTDELAPGDHKAVSVDGTPIVIFNLAGEYYAIENRCSHQDYPLSEGFLDNDQITCPLHGAKFNIKTGQVTAPPAFMDIPTFAVRIIGESIQVELP